jgi:hypothetical protein
VASGALPGLQAGPYASASPPHLLCSPPHVSSSPGVPSPPRRVLLSISCGNARVLILYPEFLQICKAVSIGFAVMGFIGYFVKLIHIPMYVGLYSRFRCASLTCKFQKQHPCVRIHSSSFAATLVLICPPFFQRRRMSLLTRQELPRQTYGYRRGCTQGGQGGCAALHGIVRFLAAWALHMYERHPKRCTVVGFRVFPLSLLLPSHFRPIPWCLDKAIQEYSRWRALTERKMAHSQGLFTAK